MMGINENVQRGAVGDFLRISEELEDDPRFQSCRDKVPFAALAQVLAGLMERLSQRTEIECKKEIYFALDKEVPSDNQLLRMGSV